MQPTYSTQLRARGKGHTVVSFCHDCGFTFPSIFFGNIGHMTEVDRLTMKGCREQCPRCGGSAEVQNLSRSAGELILGTGNSEQAQNAYIEFERRILSAVIKSNVSRNQARRFERAVARESASRMERILKEISPELHDLVKEAEAKPQEKLTIRFLAKALLVISTVGGIAGSGNQILELYDRLKVDKPVAEIIKDIRDMNESIQRKRKR